MFETNILWVKQHGYMLAWAAKWLGEKEITSYTLPDFKGYKKNPKSDRKLVMKLSQMIDEADIIVAHNGDRFDIPTTNTRLIAHGLTPPSPTKTVDTLLLARRHFRFPSNKLDELGKYLGVGEKIPTTGKHLWKGCMEGDVNSWKKMREYNIQDVSLLEQVYLKLRPWAPRHPNVNFWTREAGCRICGSDNLHRRGYDSVLGGVRKKFQCQDCGTWSRGPIEKRPRIMIQ